MPSARTSSSTLSMSPERGTSVIATGKAIGDRCISQRLGEETGGEAYYIGMSGAPGKFRSVPRRDGTASRTSVLGDLPGQGAKKSGCKRVKVSTEVSNAELVTAHEMYVERPRRSGFSREAGARNAAHGVRVCYENTSNAHAFAWLRREFCFSRLMADQSAYQFSPAHYSQHAFQVGNLNTARLISPCAPLRPAAENADGRRSGTSGWQRDVPRNSGAKRYGLGSGSLPHPLQRLFVHLPIHRAPPRLSAACFQRTSAAGPSLA